MQPTKRQQRLAKMKANGSPGFEPEVEEDIMVKAKVDKVFESAVDSIKQLSKAFAKLDDSFYNPDNKFLPAKGRVATSAYDKVAKRQTFSLKLEGVKVENLTSETYQKLLKRVSEVTGELGISVYVDGVYLTED